MWDLKQLLEQDDKYQQILAACTPEEREALQAYMAHFMNAWQTGVFDPFVSASQDPEFASTMREEMIKQGYGTEEDA